MFAARERRSTAGEPKAASKVAASRPAAPAANRLEGRPRPAAAEHRHVGNGRAAALARERRLPDPPATGSFPRIQRRCSCGGSCASCASREEERVQTHVTVGPVDDVFEREAHRVAERVTRLPEPGAADGPAAPGFDIQRVPAGGGAGPTVSSARLQGGGRPLSATTRRFMEPRFGADFRGVRLHSGPDAERTAAGLRAKAFTYGNHIWLGRSASESDRGLVAHELTHVVQQEGAPRREDPPGAGDSPSGRRKVQRVPRAQCPNGTKTLTIDLVSVEGSNHDPVADLAFANTVFRPCCVQFQLGVGISAGPDLTNQALGGDTDLAREHSCNRVHAEETALRTEATSRYGLSSRFRAFFVETTTPAARGVSFRGSDCAGGVRAPFLDHIYVADEGERRTLAHELGHLLLNTAVDDHTTHPGGTDNLLEPTNTATGSNLEPAQCATIFANA